MEGLAQLVPFVLIAVVFYLLLIRPQRKRQLDLIATQRAVAIGDEVLLGAGIVGRVAGDLDDFLEVEISPGVRMKVARGAVVRVLQPEPLDTPETVDEPEPHRQTDDPTDPPRDH